MHGHFDVKDLNSDVVSDLENSTPTGIHSGIGVVIPASKFVNTIMQKDLVEQRKEITWTSKIRLYRGSRFCIRAYRVRRFGRLCNPNHLRDFARLVDVAARKKPKRNISGILFHGYGSIKNHTPIAMISRGKGVKINGSLVC